jgi:hypothetical protein
LNQLSRFLFPTKLTLKNSNQTKKAKLITLFYLFLLQ